MPLVLSDLKNREALVTVETSAGPLEVRYRPNAMTPALEADINLAARSATDDETASASNALIRMFCAVVAAMDVVGPLSDLSGREILAAGEPMPMEPRYVSLLPTRLLIDVFTAIQEELGAGKGSASNSRAGSFNRT